MAKVGWIPSIFRSADPIFRNHATGKMQELQHTAPNLFVRKIPLTSGARVTRAKQLKLCLNFLREGQQSGKCKSETCLECKRKQHTLL